MAGKPRHKIILNPTAGGGAAEKRIPELEGLLRSHGLSYELVRTEGSMHAAELASAAAREGFDVVVGAGGDGTGNEVLNGLMQAGRSGRKLPAMGLLCVGRGNDFAYGAGVPAELAEGVELLARGERRPRDVGLVSGGDYPQGRYFGNGIGIGFDTIVGLEAAKMKWAQGFIGYVIGALRTMFLYYRAPRLAIDFEGKRLEQKALQISVMNGRRMGGAFFVCPRAEDDDGLLDLNIAGEPRRMEMLGLILMYMKGTQASSRHIKTGRTAAVEIRALEGNLVVHADGETIGLQADWLRAECLPRAVEMVSRGGP